MLFELGGKRKRLIQVIYVCLALLMFVGLVGLGIGSNVSGGIFDALGIGGGNTSSSPQYDAQIERAEKPCRRTRRTRRRSWRSPAPTSSPVRPRPRPTIRGASP